MKPFIKDNERVLDATTDLLKTGVYAKSLEKVIENTPQDVVFTNFRSKTNRNNYQ